MTDPTPRTAVTARDALVAKVTSDWDADPYGEYEAARSRLIADLDNLIALAAAEAPGRVAALEAVAKRAASMGGCSQVHHDYVIAAAREALAIPTPNPERAGGAVRVYD